MLDLDCAEGGIAMGYSQAGFTEIVGVDIEPMPRYPFKFVQADALCVLVHLKAGHTVAGYKLEDFDLIHVSPPCQKFTRLRFLPWLRDKYYPDELTRTLDLLRDVATPWVIENVPDAPLPSPIRLCGTMFGLKLYRHRHFQTNWPLLSPAHPKHQGVIGNGRGINDRRNGTEGWIGAYGHQQSASVVGPAMGIDWMSSDGLSQAMPPAFGRFIGWQFKRWKGAA